MFQLHECFQQQLNFFLHRQLSLIDDWRRFYILVRAPLTGFIWLPATWISKKAENYKDFWLFPNSCTFLISKSLYGFSKSDMLKSRFPIPIKNKGWSKVPALHRHVIRKAVSRSKNSTLKLIFSRLSGPHKMSTFWTGVKIDLSDVTFWA